MAEGQAINLDEVGRPIDRPGVERPQRIADVVGVRVNSDYEREFREKLDEIDRAERNAEEDLHQIRITG